MQQPYIPVISPVLYLMPIVLTVDSNYYSYKEACH